MLTEIVTRPHYPPALPGRIPRPALAAPPGAHDAAGRRPDCSRLPRRAPPVNRAFRADEAARSVTASSANGCFSCPARTSRPSSGPPRGWRTSSAPGITGGRRTTSTAWWTPAAANWATAATAAAALTDGPSQRRPPGFAAGDRHPAAEPAHVRQQHYDDMAWLALSTLRLEKLAEESRRPGRRRNAESARPSRCSSIPPPRTTLAAARSGAKTGLQEHPRHRPRGPVLRPHRQPGQGPGPAGLAGRQALRPEPGPLPGRRADQRTGEVMVESAIYTYNQGPVLGALLELGGDATWPARPRWWRRCQAALTRPSPDKPGRRSSAATERATADSSPGSWPATWQSPPSTPASQRPSGPPQPGWSWTPRTPSGTAGAPSPPNHWRGTQGLPFLPARNTGGRHVSARCRRRTLHPAPGMDAAGSGRGNPARQPPRGPIIRSRNSYVIDVILLT